MTWLDIHEDAFDEMFYPEGVEIDKLIKTLQEIKQRHPDTAIYFKNISARDCNYQYIHIG